MLLFMLLSMFSSVQVSSGCGDNHHRDGNTKQAVGDVERGPVFARPVPDVDKIPYPSVVEYPVVEIAADAGREHCEGDVG